MQKSAKQTMRLSFLFFPNVLAADLALSGRESKEFLSGDSKQSKKRCLMKKNQSSSMSQCSKAHL